MRAPPFGVGSRSYIYDDDAKCQLYFKVLWSTERRHLAATEKYQLPTACNTESDFCVL